MMKRKNMDVSRRQFIIGAGLAGLGAAGAGLVGCSPKGSSGGTKGATTAEASPGGQGSASIIGNPAGANAGIDWEFKKAPADIPEAEIIATEEVDVLVVGCGWAGVVASTAAAEKGAKTLCIEKGASYSGRGGHIAAFGSKIIQEHIDAGWFSQEDYAHTVRRLIMWATGRVKEPLLWEFAKKSGACMDWLVDLVADSGLHPTLWAGYYKGPDYTEVPTHFFYDDTTDFVYLDGISTGLGMSVLIPAVMQKGEEFGVEYRFKTPCVRLLRDGNGPVTGVIAGEEGNYSRINAKAVIIATGDYLDDDEMRTCYQPFTWYADDRIYVPFDISTGDLHKQALWIGGAMQESEPHCSTIHLESGAQSYNFLHVNAEGNRFMNEDVNTQSKSCAKAFQPDGGKAFTIYDAKSLEKFAESCNQGISGGISSDQQYRRFGVAFDMEVELKLREAKIEQGLLFQADSLEELAELTGIPAKNLIATVDRYNELCDKGNDDDYGKRPEVMWKIAEPPFFAGQLVSTLLASSGGLRTDADARLLDGNNAPIENLYVCGAAAGQYFSNDYPTIVPGHNHGRCLTFGRIAGINAAGGDASSEIPSLDITAFDMPEADRVNTLVPSK